MTFYLLLVLLMGMGWGYSVSVGWFFDRLFLCLLGRAVREDA